MRSLARVVAAALAAAFAGAAYVYLSLPDVRPLKGANPSTTAFIELRAREVRSRGAAPRRVQRWVPYARISSNLKRAVLVAEDAGFWRHEGIEFEQMKESIEANLERLEFARGGSTITQQLAKNLYLSPSKNPVRKLKEILIARRLEAELTKQRILELYLNVVEWGDGIYGAEAAARTYFGKPAADLGAQEAALLAGALINPRLHSPGRPTARLRRRQQMIMRRMGAVTPPPAVADLPPPKTPEQDETPQQAAPVSPGGEGGTPLTPPGEPLPPGEETAPRCEHPPCG